MWLQEVDCKINCINLKVKCVWCVDRAFILGSIGITEVVLRRVL